MRRAGGWTRRRALTTTSAAVAGVVAVVLGLLLVLGDTPWSDGAPAPVAVATTAPAPPAPTSDSAPGTGTGIDADAGTDTTGDADTDAEVEPATEGMSLSVPALGLRTDVDEVSPVGGTIDPPTFDRAYRIAPYGTPGSDNTTYIAGHSWNAGDAVFNPLLDVGTQQATLSAGDTVEVVEDGVTFSYEVVSAHRYPKGTLADVTEVWQKVPGRLVLITCFQLDSGARSRDNLVVTAQLVTAGGRDA